MESTIKEKRKQKVKKKIQQTITKIVDFQYFYVTFKCILLNPSMILSC